MLKPWTQTVSLHWRSELRYHEVRVALLRAFEDAGVLRAFRIGEDSIDARIFDQDHQLSVSQSSLTLQLLRPDADREAAWDVVAQALEMVRPAAPESMTVALQHISPIDAPFEVSVQQSLEQFFSLPGSATAQARDWSLLLDLSVEDEAEPSGQTEVGIARKWEFPPRLARLLGRMGGPRSWQVAPNHWQEVEFPEVAFFADTIWRKEAPDSQSLLEAAWRYWDDALPRTARFVAELRGNVLGQETEGDPA